MKKFLRLSVYFIIICASWYTSQSRDWSAIQEQILIVTSVIAAAVFVRLNRSLPTMDTGKLLEGQVTRITQSYKSSSKALAAHAVVVLVTISYSIFLLPSLNIIFPLDTNLNFLPEFLLCLLFGHVLVKAADIIFLDLDFVNLQSGLLDKQAKNSEEMRTESTFRNANEKLNIPEGYGDIKNDIVKDEKK